jgi:AraC-like DNA-binding protein
MDSVASSLHMTSRTLRQKLSDEAESFQHLKDSLRRDQAINLLNETRLTIGEVGQRVGFTKIRPLVGNREIGILSTDLTDANL